MRCVLTVLVMGTYIHGIFDNDAYRRQIINALRLRKGLVPLKATGDTQVRKEESYNRLADTVRNSLDMGLIYRLMGMDT